MTAMTDSKETQVIASMGYQSKSVSSKVGDLLRQHHLLQEAADRDLTLSNMPRRLLDARQPNLSRNQKQHLAVFVAAALDPKLKLSQGSLDAFMAPVKEPTTRSSHRHDSWMLEAYAGMMSAFLHHCISTLGSAPTAATIVSAGRWVAGEVRLHDGLHRFGGKRTSFLMWNRDYLKSPLAKSVANLSDIAALDILMERIHTESRESDFLALTYADITGVPVEWVDDSITASMAEEGSGELDWSNVPGKAIQSSTLMKRFEAQR